MGNSQHDRAHLATLSDTASVLSVVSVTNANIDKMEDVREVKRQERAMPVFQDGNSKINTNNGINDIIRTNIRKFQNQIKIYIEYPRLVGVPVPVRVRRRLLVDSPTHPNYTNASRHVTMEV